MNKLKEELGVSQSVISRIVKEAGIKVSSGRKPSKSIDENFFEVIDTEKKAYWFGFLYADGHITEKGFSVCVKRSDRDHLLKLAFDMKSTYTVGDYTNKGFEGKLVLYSKMAVTSPRLRECLVDKNMIPRKSLVLKPPACDFKDGLERHFIRGFFDGNGSMSGNKKTTYAAKICSTDDMLLWICETSGVSVKKLFKRRPSDVVSSLEISSLKMDKFLKYMYSNCEVYLTRKYEKVQNVLKCRNVVL
ncbi:MAG: hypothetical protein ACRC0G_01040 [Fusobacteriaceae bacterium]